MVKYNCKEMKIFLIVIVIVTLLLLLKTTVFAQEATGEATVIPTLQASPSGQAPIPYELPYPGILPDHPLWSLKALRDKIISFLIGDPVKKAEFDLSQADKRLNAGVYLFKKGKGDLAYSTISKGENYFEQSVSKIAEARRVGKDINSLKSLILRAAQKHQAVLAQLIKQYPNFSAPLGKELERIGSQEKIVNE